MTLFPGKIYAQALLEALNIHGAPDPEDIAKRIGLAIEEADADGFEGALVRPVGVPLGAIALKKGVREKGRRNFTIAHEIGHFVLPGHDSIGNVCSSQQIESWSTDINHYEQEANEFAGELLIPTAQASPIVTKRLPSLKVIKEVAQHFNASLTASGWRFCELTPERCAMVMSTKRRIVWYKAAEDFRFHIKVGDEIEEGTVALDCFLGRKIPSAPVSVAASLWLASSNLLPQASVWEESILLPYYDSVLTLLWIKDRIERDAEWDEREEELLEPLDPQEFTLRRRKWPGKR
ncbi:MAG: ImmA/IrrE family metallo-endopeptidase [Acidobacteria bacterium]|nr:ImmA/IrrE family metallo-endopeptidase [Acidobacteriota bacterium]